MKKEWSRIRKVVKKRRQFQGYVLQSRNDSGKYTRFFILRQFTECCVRERGIDQVRRQILPKHIRFV